MSHTNGSLTARHVVVALAAATPVWMGNIVKVVAVYRHAFWREVGLSGSAISHVGPLREIHDMSGVDLDPAALFGFAPLSPGVPAPTHHDIVAQLTEIFGPQASAPAEVLIKDWRTDAPGGAAQALQRSPMDTSGHRHYQQPAGDGRLHWASTETAPHSPGHIEGTIRAAERAVAAVMSSPTDFLSRT